MKASETFLSAIQASEKLIQRSNSTMENITPTLKRRLGQTLDRIEQLKEAGARVLVVGDGLNDAPSLACATVSISPASAMDITQNVADIVYQSNKLQPILTSWNIARASQKLVRQNFALSIGYNIIAIPLAVAGFVTPLVAAIAMSSSSLLVVANALRLSFKRKQRQ